MSLIELSAADLAAKLSSGEVSSVEATQAHLDRIAAVDGDVHAFLHVSQTALADAAADGAVVHVELADRDRDAGGQAEPVRPGRRQRAGRRRGVVGLLVQPVAQLGELGFDRVDDRRVTGGGEGHRVP